MADVPIAQTVRMMSILRRTLELLDPAMRWQFKGPNINPKIVGLLVKHYTNKKDPKIWRNSHILLQGLKVMLGRSALHGRSLLTVRFALAALEELVQLIHVPLQHADVLLPEAIVSLFLLLLLVYVLVGMFPILGPQ